MQKLLGWIGTGPGGESIQAGIYGMIGVTLLIMSLVIFFVYWLIMKFVYKKRVSLLRDFIFSVLLVSIVFFAMFILPNWTDEIRWNNLQQTCARQVGYVSPEDNNNPAIMTAQSQTRYNSCLSEGRDQ